MSHQTNAQVPTVEEIEAFARAREPHVWALDPPDFSAVQYRRVGGLKSQVQRLANPAAANSMAMASSGVFQPSV